MKPEISVLSGASRRNKGNTLILFSAISLVLLIAVALIMLNFNQLFGGHKEVANAADAAALAAARDMGRVVVDCQLGRIALVDDGPGSNGYPVQSVNTVMGNLRLNSIIASRLGNTTLQWLVAQDVTRLNCAVGILKQKLELARAGSSGAYDKDGNAIIIGGTSGSAMNSYRGNSRRMLGNDAGQVDPSNLSIEFGSLLSPLSSQVPIPNPTTGDTASYSAANTYTDSSTTKYYLSDTDYPIVGLSNTQQVRFVAVSQGQPALVDTANFKSNLASNELPSVVRVTVTESTKMITNKNSTASGMLQRATAQAGGTITSLLTPSGALVVSFAGPIPPDPAASGANSLKFDTVQHIINASQFAVTDSKPASSYNGWHSTDNQVSVGNWSEATGGNIPGGGSFPASGKPFKGIAGRENDDPSIALTCLVYDWLRTLGTRPNLNSVCSALTSDLRSFNSTSKQFSAQEEKKDWLPLAYAQASSSAAETTGVFQLDGNGENDPRNLRFWNEHPEEYQRQQARMWGYLPGEGVMPPDTKMVQLTADGAVTTMDGHPVADLNDIQDQINFSNVWANITLATTFELIVEKAKQEAQTDTKIQQLMAGGNADDSTKEQLTQRAKQLIADVMKKNPRLEAAYANAQYITQATAAMKKNLKSLSSVGASRVGEMHFKLMEGDFYPISCPATKELLAGSGRCNTGQDRSLGAAADWCRPLKADKSSQLTFFEEAKELAIKTSRNPAGSWLPVAMAQSANPSNSDNKFIFCLYDKDATKLGNFRVMLTKATTSPFASVPTYKGQAHYQDVKAIVLAATNDNTQKVEWQVQAKDEIANAYPSQSDASAQPNQSAAATHFNSQDKTTAYCSAANGAKCPGLVAEWALTCPLVQAPPPQPPAQPPVVVQTPPPPPPCSRVPADGSGFFAAANGIFGNWGTTDGRGGYVHGAFTGQYATLATGGGWPWGYYQYWDTKGYNTAVGGPYFVSTVYYYYYTCDPRPIYYAT